MRWPALACGAVAGLAGGLARAAAPGGQTPPALPGFGGLLTTVGGLVFILALIFGAAWLLKRVGHLPAGGRGLVKILGGVSLGARERVVVVEVEETRLVLGVAPGRVQTLHVLPADSGFERTLSEAREQSR